MKLIIFRTIFFLAICAFSFNINAQDKTTVGVWEFTNSGDVNIKPQYVSSIKEIVNNAFLKTKRFTVVDRSKMDQVSREKEMQKSEDFIDGSVVQQGVSLGADYLIAGHVVSTEAQYEIITGTGGYTKDRYKGRVSVQLKVIDVATGEVKAAEILKASTYMIHGKSPGEAISLATGRLKGYVDLFIAKNFPVTFVLHSIEEKNKKGGASIVLISGGSEMGLIKGYKLSVLEVTEIDLNGKKLERKKEIGVMKITKVEGPDVSLCKVTSGGIDINTKFDENATLEIVRKFK